MASTVPLVFAAIGAAVLPVPARAHYDGMDGPVVKAAQQALATGDPSPVLIWVTKADEPQIRSAFEQALNVRKLGPAARIWPTPIFLKRWCACTAPPRARRSPA